MKKFIGFLFVFLLAIPLNAQTPVSTPVSKAEVYQVLDDLFHLENLVTERSVQQTGFKNVAYARLLALYATYSVDTSREASFLAEKANFYDLAFPLYQLLFQKPGHQGSWPSDLWSYVANNLHYDYKINTDDFLEGKYYYDWDVIYSGTLSKFKESIQKASWPVIYFPAAEWTIGDQMETDLSASNWDVSGNGFSSEFLIYSNIIGVQGQNDYVLGKGKVWNYDQNWYRVYGKKNTIEDSVAPSIVNKFVFGKINLTPFFSGNSLIYQTNQIWTRDGKDDLPAWGLPSVFICYQRADVNKNQRITISDAVFAGFMLLRKETPSPLHLGDVNYDGNFDPNDPSVIFKSLGEGGGGKGTATTEDSETPTEGKISWETKIISDGLYEISIGFKGNPGTANFLAAEFTFPKGAVSEKSVIFSLPDCIQDISGHYWDKKNNQLRILLYGKILEGKLLSFKVSGEIEEATLQPLGKYFFTSDEKIEVIKSKVLSVLNQNSTPETFSLSQNYPNPFNPSTKISFGLPQSVKATLKVYDMLGREVATLVDEELSAGNHETIFDASGLSSGIYIYRLTAGDFTETERMSLLK